MKIKVGLLFPGLSSLCIAAFTAGCTGWSSSTPKDPSVMRSVSFHCGDPAYVDRRCPRLRDGFLVCMAIQGLEQEGCLCPEMGFFACNRRRHLLVPLAIVTILASLTWKETFRLDPYKPIISARQPVNVQAVSLDWKWLFIYPDHDIAVVNHLVFPAGVPLSFRITSETVMTSLFIPQLGSQMYGMTGMETRLNLLARETGVYMGQKPAF